MARAATTLGINTKTLSHEGWYILMVPADLLACRSDPASKIRNGMPKQLFRLSA
jgi:hypothetical protein